MLPSLRYLFISLEGSLKPEDIQVGETTRILEAAEMLLQPMDDPDRTIDSRDYRIGLPSSMFIEQDGAWAGGPTSTIREAMGRRRNHRRVAGSLRKEAVQRHLPGVGNAESRTHWLCHSRMDLPYCLKRPSVYHKGKASQRKIAKENHKRTCRTLSSLSTINCTLTYARQGGKAAPPSTAGNSVAAFRHHSMPFHWLISSRCPELTVAGDGVAT